MDLDTQSKQSPENGLKDFNEHDKIPRDPVVDHYLRRAAVAEDLSIKVEKLEKELKGLKGIVFRNMKKKNDNLGDRHG